MSVDSVEQYLKPSTWEKLIKNYVSNELIPSNWTCFSTSLIENLQSLLAKSHGVLRIHESPKLLAAAVMAFNRYPGCFKEIGVELEDRFKNDVTVYRSLKGKRYIYKIELCSVIYQALYTSIAISKWKLVNETVVLCLKNLESIMANRSEMIEYPEEKLMEMEEAVFLTSTSSMDDAFIEKKEMVKDSEDVIIKWKEMLDKCGYSESEQELLDVLNDTFRHFPVKGNEKTYTKIYNWLRVIISRIFYFAVGNIMPNKTESTPIVRLFCENKDYIVMAHELVQTMKREKMNVSELENSMRQEPILKCFSFNELAQIVDKEDLKRLEFVKIPIQKSRFAFTPIPTTYGGYCIPLLEVVRQIQIDMVQCKKVLQMATETDLPFFDYIFLKVFKMFSSCYFVDLKDMEVLKKGWNELFEHQFKDKIVNFQPKEIRKVNERRGFTVDDLKNELEYLNLTRAFPEIKKEAEEVYDYLKELPTMNTTHMIISVHSCQMECFRKRFVTHYLPAMKGELVISGTESTTGLASASSSSESSELPSSESTTVSITECSSDSSSESIESTEKIPTISISSDSSESIPPPKETKKEKKKLKKLRRKEKISREEKEEKPKEKESNTCPKCFRSSEFSRKTNEKLRISKIECKSLKKKLDEKTRKEEENERLIRELKEKLEQKEKKIEELIGENEEIEKKLEEKHQKMNAFEAEKESLRWENEKLKKGIQPMNRPISILSEESKDALFDLLTIRNTIKTENPLKKSQQITTNLSNKSNDETVQRMSRCEFIQFEKFCKIYVKSLNSHIEWVSSQPEIASNWTPNLPNFPQFSQCFLIEYKKTMKSESPEICESLVKKSEEEEEELQDRECLICTDDIGRSFENTVKCDDCKRRYHDDCLSEWLKIKRTCPACSRLMLNRNEFPPLTK